MQQRQYRENQNQIYINKLNQNSQSWLKNGNKQLPLPLKKHHNDCSKHRKISRKYEPSTKQPSINYLNKTSSGYPKFEKYGEGIQQWYFTN